MPARVTRYSNFIEEIETPRGLYPIVGCNCVDCKRAREATMPIKKVKGGYRWGSKGKVYKRRKDAVAQAQAAHASGYVEPKSKGK